MTTQPFDDNDRSFMAAVGLDTDDLEALVADAPPVPDDAAARIRQRVQERIVAPVPADRTVLLAPAARRPARRRLVWTAAAAAVILALTVAISGTGLAQEMLHRLYKLVPGWGIADTQQQALVLKAPVTVTDGEQRFTLSSALANHEETVLKIHVEGVTLPAGPEGLLGKPQELALILPDGQRIRSEGFLLNQDPSRNALNIIMTFHSLPADTRTARLELTNFAGLIRPIKADLAFEPAAGRAIDPRATSAVAERAGITARVTSVAADKEQIYLALEMSARSPEAQVGSLWSGTELVDDHGNRYDLSLRDGLTITREGKPLYAAFSGPLKPGARKLKLTVPAVVVTYPVEPAAVRLDLSRVPKTGSAEINETVQVGQWPLTITRAAWSGPDMVKLDVSPGKGPDGTRLLGFPQATSFNPSLYLGDLNDALYFKVSPGATEVKVVFSQVSVIEPGPWVMEFPAP